MTVIDYILIPLGIIQFIALILYFNIRMYDFFRDEIYGYVKFEVTKADGTKEIFYKTHRGYRLLLKQAKKEQIKWFV